MNSTSEKNEKNTALKDLFLADLDRLEESIWRNEEIGEKRFSFFVTLASAVAGGLVALPLGGEGAVGLDGTRDGRRAGAAAGLDATGPVGRPLQGARDLAVLDLHREAHGLASARPLRGAGVLGCRGIDIPGAVVRSSRMGWEHGQRKRRDSQRDSGECPFHLCFSPNFRKRLPALAWIGAAADVVRTCDGRIAPLWRSN